MKVQAGILAGIVIMHLCVSEPALAQTSHVFPLFVNGQVGGGTFYNASMTIYSSGSNPTDCSLRFYGATIAIVGLGTSDRFDFTIPANGWAYLKTDPNQAFQIGYATLSCSASVSAHTEYGLYSSNIKTGATTVFSASEGTTARFVADQVEAGARLGIAIANNTDSDHNYTVSIGNAAGAMIGTAIVTVPARRSLSRYIDELVGGTAGIVSFVTVTGSSFFSSVGFRFVGGVFTAVPAVVTVAPVAQAPIIDNITLSTEPAGRDTLVKLTVDVRSNVPVNWFEGSFEGPNGNIWGGGSGRTFTEVTPGLWRLINTDRVSEFAPSGQYRYGAIRVRNAGMLRSDPWPGELKVTITNSVQAQVPTIESIALTTELSGRDTLIKLTVDARSNVPVNWFEGSFEGPNGNIWGGGSGRTFTEVTPGLWRLINTDRISEFAPSGQYRYTGIRVKNAGMLRSDPWPGELKVTITNSVQAQVPTIETITLSTELSGRDTLIKLTVDVRSNVPVNWLEGSFEGPNGNIWGGGSGRTFTEVTPGLWRLINTDRISEFAPSGQYQYMSIRVKNAGMFRSDPWPGELKVNISN